MEEREASWYFFFLIFCFDSFTINCFSSFFWEDVFILKFTWIERYWSNTLYVVQKQSVIFFFSFFNLDTEPLKKESVQVRPRKIKVDNRPGNAIAFYSCPCLARIKSQEIKSLHNSASGICFSALTSSDVHSSFYLCLSLSHFPPCVGFCTGSVLFPGQNAQACNDQQLRDDIQAQCCRAADSLGCLGWG